MSDNEATKAKAPGWTDRERLAYLVSLLEHSDTKLNFKTAPRPPNRTEIACQRMVERLKTTLKAELDALKAGLPMPSDDTPKATPKATPKKATPRKRKGKEEGGEGEGEGEGDGSPKKRGRKKKEVKSEEKVEETVEGEAEEV